MKVSGLLTKDRAQLPGNTIASSAIRYRIAGEQVFNTVHQRWESGKMDIAVSMQFMREGKNVGFATGTMTLTLERLPQP